METATQMSVDVYVAIAVPVGIFSYVLYASIKYARETKNDLKKSVKNKF
jgi:hypothetical protein